MTDEGLPVAPVADAWVSAEPVLAVTGSNLTGTVPFSAALRHQGRVDVRSSPAGERGDLAVLCRDLLAANGLTAADVRALRIDVGPGSYTGLRVAVTFVRFLQAFGEVTVQAVSSLALLAAVGAAQRGRPSAGSPFRPMLDARRGRWHVATVECVADSWRETGAPAALPVDEAVSSIGVADVVVAPRAFVLAEHARLAVANELVAVEAVDAGHLFLAGLPWFAAAAEQLEPRYLMASYAE